MGVLKFDAVDDRLRWTTLATPLANVSDGAWTLAVLVRRETAAVWGGMSYLESGGGTTPEAGASFNGATEDITIDIAGTAREFAGTFSDTTNPYMFAISKAAGATTPRMAWKLGSGGSWAHVDATGGTLADQIASNTLDIGVLTGTVDPFDGWIGLVGWWEGAMSDANKEALDDNWRTSDWWASAHGQPAFLAELNVAAGSVVDLAGNASSTSHTGPALDAGETLNSWNFDGTGAVVTPAVSPNVRQFPVFLLSGKRTV